ncbi:hypothetical protein NGK12_11550 [Raoultella ornithinolytica]|uniref:hypothetical protein n=1 Tax=Raoultella ornithinolytica TaxID=54291 RepID=UPI002DBB5450|nr:hypothetical protein [Raoultella ornithinolytica]MEB7861196.1 hypothetical protein [Raoultella ornithinolytica]MEB7983149.1 hypothetical protein [Raoultella ornithinolytica]
MNHYFISDNSWFLAGLRESECYFIYSSRKQGTNFFYIHTDSCFGQFKPTPGDVVVLNITNVSVFSHVMSHAEMMRCRLIIMFSPRLTGGMRMKSLFPYFIPDDVSISALISCIAKAANASVEFKKTSTKDIKLFKCIGLGYSVFELSRLMKLSIKSVYHRRRERLTKYGFETHHPLIFIILEAVLKVSGVSN